jgi:hypothetical protein
MRGGKIKVYVDDAAWVTWAAAGPVTLEEACKLTDSNLADARAESERRTRCDDETGVNPGTRNPTEITFDYMPQQGPTAGDSVYALLSAAYEGSTSLSVAYVDGNVDVVGSEVLYWGEMYVFDLSRSDPLDGESTVSCVLKQVGERSAGSPERNKVTTAP